MIQGSLRWRLLAGAALAILTALVIAWVIMILLFGRHIEQRMVTELTRSGLQLVAAAGSEPALEPALQTALSDPRLQTPASGLYWQVGSASGQVLRSRSLWDQTLPRAADPPSDGWRVRSTDGPFGPRLLIVEREVNFGAATPPLVVQIAQDATDIAVAQREFGLELAAFLVLLWLVLSAAAWLQVDLGLKPLSRMRAEVDALRFRPAARIRGGDLREITPLTEAINALVDARADDLQRARRRAADMAHGLKTPLAALASQVRRLPVDEPAVQGLEGSIAAIHKTVTAELARSRIAASHAGPGLSARPALIVQQLVAVLSHTERGEEVAFDLQIPEDMSAPLDGADLTEILGAILENAVRHAEGSVRVTGEARAGVRLVVEDNGHGMAPSAREAIMERRARQDERGGSGLGLSIAQGLMDATGGSMSLLPSSLGGLCVELCWPSPARVS
jgi:signal transduction histidine kinase